MKKLIVITDDKGICVICSDKLKKDRVKHVASIFEDIIKFEFDGSYEIIIKQLEKGGELHKYYCDLSNSSPYEDTF